MHGETHRSQGDNTLESPKSSQSSPIDFTKSQAKMLEKMRETDKKHGSAGNDYRRQLTSQEKQDNQDLLNRYPAPESKPIPAAPGHIGRYGELKFLPEVLKKLQEIQRQQET